jgi:hypothetical protein
MLILSDTASVQMLTIRRLFNIYVLKPIVEEPHRFYTDPALGANFDGALAAPALAPSLLHIKPKFSELTRKDEVLSFSHVI